jgi:sialic acid synthase SpsE
VSESDAVVAVGTRRIGAGERCYLIAEAGTTSGGDLDRAIALVHAAADAGMDAVKFQLIDPSQLSDPTVTYPMVVDGRVVQVNMKEMFEKLIFSERQWTQIAQAATDRGIQFFATVDYLAGVDVLERVGVPAHKIGAWDGTYRELIERIGRTGKPMFVDLGPTSEAEVDAILRWYRDAGGPAPLLLHDFHTDVNTQMNLRAIEYLRSRLPWPVGYSSPARDDDLDFAALGLGAAYIEKRLILDRRLPVFHAHESLEPVELGQWVARIRHVERALGRAAILPSDKDRDGARLYYRSVCTLRAIRKGETLDRTNLGAKRPGTGISAAQMGEVLGKRAARDMPADTLIVREDFL